MTQIDFVEHRFSARVPELTNPTNTVDVPLLVRVDPLTGHSARIISGEKLSPAQRPDLTPLAEPPAFCPFCADQIETATGTFVPEVSTEGRIRRGQAVVVANVLAYSEFSAVGVYDTNTHFLDLPELTGERIGDLLGAFVDYTRGLRNLSRMWSSINANYLPPSGSSLIHPHAQSAHDDIGTTVQRRLVALSDEWSGSDPYWAMLLAVEENGPRWIGRQGRVSFLTPWAPVGFHETWAVVAGCSSLEDLTDEDCAALGTGMSATLQAYHSLNLTSFNWALYGGSPAPSERYWTLLRMVSRANPDPMYRSDVTYFERLHQEAMIDLSPEDCARAIRTTFAGATID